MTRRHLLKVVGGTLAFSLLPPSASSADVLTDNGENPMKIVVLTGSPHRQGTSALLADEFIAGAVSKGHAIVRFDTAFEKVGPCRACYYCDRHDGECIQKDAMRKILPEILSADMIVLVTPLYYFNMTAQLKTVLDRLMPQRAALRKHPMKSAMLVTCGSNTDWNMDAIMAHYEVLQQYLPWEDQAWCSPKTSLPARTLKARTILRLRRLWANVCSPPTSRQGGTPSHRERPP